MRFSVTLLLVTTCVALEVTSSGLQADRAGRYITFNAATNWNSASKFCKDRQSQLAYPDTPDEAFILQELMTANGLTSIHLGFHGLFGAGKYHTILGAPFAKKCYSGWAAGYPTDVETDKCGGLTAEGIVNIPCDSIQPFICEEKITWSGYELIRGLGYYKYYTDTERTWNEALELCRAEGAHMLVVNSDVEYKLLLDKYSFDPVWVGLQHILEDQRFLSIFDSDLANVGYSTWSSGEPSGTNLEKPYVALIGGRGLALRETAATLYVICEQEYIPIFQ